jgi:protein TonB
MAARRLLQCAIAACVGLVAAPAWPEPAHPPPPPIPTGADFDGLVRLRCTLQANGSLTECEIVAEEPMGQGLGERALQMAPTLRVRLRNANGSSATGERVTVPVHFVIAPAERSPQP